MLNVIMSTAFTTVLGYLSPLLFILMAVAVGDKLVDFVKSSITWIGRRRGY